MRNPFLPSIIISDGPVLISYDIIGKEKDCASINVIGKPSAWAVHSKTS